MRLKIKLHPNSSQEKIDTNGVPRKIFLENLYKGQNFSKDFLGVWIKEKPIDGKANSYLEKFLKKEFKANVKVIKGLKSKNKVVEIK